MRMMKSAKTYVPMTWVSKKYIQLFCPVLERDLALAQCKSSSLFPFFLLFSSRTMGHSFILSFWSLTSRDKKNDFTRASQKNYSLGLSSVTSALCTSLSCEIDPFLLISVLPQSFPALLALLPPSALWPMLPHYVFCLKSLDYLVLP